MTLDDGTFTTEIVLHTGGGAIARYRYAALPDISSTQTFIRRGVLNRCSLLLHRSGRTLFAAPRQLGALQHRFVPRVSSLIPAIIRFWVS